MEIKPLFVGVVDVGNVVLSVYTLEWSFFDEWLRKSKNELKSALFPLNYCSNAKKTR